MTRSFTFDSGVVQELPTRNESYQNGFDTGMSWHDTYRPGGPFVFRVHQSLTNDRGWAVYCAASLENNWAWLEGFDTGYNALKTGEMAIMQNGLRKRVDSAGESH